MYLPTQMKRPSPLTQPKILSTLCISFLFFKKQNFNFSTYFQINFASFTTIWGMQQFVLVPCDHTGTKGCFALELQLNEANRELKHKQNPKPHNLTLLAPAPVTHCAMKSGAFNWKQAQKQSLVVAAIPTQNTSNSPWAQDEE